MDEESRSARKRRAIMEAATTLFLRNGYQGTSMDEVAALAVVSKQTVYKHFADKRQLFSDIILGMTGRVDDFIEAVAVTLEGTDDLEDDLEKRLGELARRYVTTVINPQVLQVRRLVLREAGRFPELARSYYQRAPQRTITALAAGLRQLAERGLLRLDDPLLAANHLAWLVLAMPLDRAMFHADEDERIDPAELERIADAGVRVFLAAYGQPEISAARPGS